MNSCKMCPLKQLLAPNHDCSDYKIKELMASLRFGPRLLWKKQPILILIVCSIPHPHTHHHHHHYHQTPPHPLFIVSLWTQVVMAEAVGLVDFQEKKAAAELVKRPL